MTELMTLHFKSRREWRVWLAKHHAGLSRVVKKSTRGAKLIWSASVRLFCCQNPPQANTAALIRISSGQNPCTTE